MIDPTLPIEYDDGSECEVARRTASDSSIGVVSRTPSSRRYSENHYRYPKNVRYFRTSDGVYMGFNAQTHRTIRNKVVGPLTIEDWRL